VTDEERFRTAFFGIDVTFANVSGTLQAAGDPSGFALVDEGYDIRPIIFKTSLRGDVVRIEAAMRDNVEGLKLMYGAGLYPYCNITDGRDMSLPVFGPVAIQETIAMSPYALDWRVSAIQPIDVAITDQQYLPIDDLPSKVRSFPAPFVAMAAELGSNRGRVFFATDLVADEPMDVRLRFGYDGPFRMWVDREVVYTDADGVNPIILDEHQIALRLAQGTHRITCAMDYATGLAWGFALRFDRPDISREQAMAGASLRAEWRAA
jgi:sialate O-acetylesterase